MIFIVVLLIVSISFVGLAVCLIIIFVGIGCARRLMTSVLLNWVYVKQVDTVI